MTVLAHKDGNKEQLLARHSYNVAEGARENAKDIGQGHVLFLLGLYHDLGKADPKFQRKLKQEPDMHVDHSYAGARYLFTKAKTLFGYEPFVDIITYVIAAHHSLFDVYNATSPARNKLYERLLLKDGYHYDVVEQYAHQLEGYLIEYGYDDLDDLLEKAYNEHKKAVTKLDAKTRVEEAYYQAQFVRLYLSYLKNADILDTINAYETVIEPPTDDHRDIYLHKIENVYAGFQNPTTPLNCIRTELAETIKARSIQDTAGVYRLDLPTGAGKTNLSMRYAFHQMVYQNKKRMIYTAPFLSILEQNAANVRKVIGDAGITEHHSNIIERDDSPLARYCTDTWDNEVILTTMVQFFQTLYKTRANNVRRFSNLANSVLILDEVQSLPIKTTHLFNLMANFLARVMNVTLVLCTATQPLYDDENIFHTIRYGGTHGEEADLIQLTQEERAQFDRTNVEKWSDEPHQLEEIAKAILDGTTSTLAILNTKKAVDRLYELVRTQTKRPVYYLSTNQCAQHRLDLLAQIKKDLADEKPVICISTQLIEAGVDVDFDWVIRSYAGVDSLIQAAGRCNREGLRDKGRVTLIKVDGKEENVGKLKDIRTKKKAAEAVLSEQGRQVRLEELNQPFYQSYYANNAYDMDYSLEQPGESAFDYLSTNNFQPVQKGILTQAFKTAGENIDLITEETISVIVPYHNEADIKELEKLLTYDIKKVWYPVKQLLKKLQRTTIQVFPSDDILSCVKSYQGGDILILPEGYYNEHVGLVRAPENSVF